MAVSDWSTTASSNASALGIDIGEGCSAANINNALREVMAQLKTKMDAIDALVGSGSSGAQPLDAQLTALAGLSPTGNQVPLFTGPSAASLLAVSVFAQSLLDDADAAAACNTLGAVRVTAKSLANPGYVKFQVASGQFFMVAWGTCTIAANGSTSVSYAAAFPTASFAVLNAVRQDTGSQDNDAGVISCTTTGFTAFSASDTSNSGRYIAVGY